MSEPHLPIEVVPNSRPPRFCWQQRVQTPAGTTTVQHEGQLPPTVEDAVVELIGKVSCLDDINEHLRKSYERLQKFKDWVHAYLDARGVPAEFPDGSHTREGCRIGDRMDWVFAQLDEANRRANAAETLNSNQRQELDQAKQPAPTPAKKR